MLRHSRGVFADVGIRRPALKREDDPVWWDAHHARIDELAKRRDALQPENWLHSRQLAVLMVQRSHAALDCIAHINGIYATQADFAFLRNAGYAVRPLGARYHQLTPEGKRVARDICIAVAKRLGLHHISYVMDSWSEHKVRCTCGWFASLNRRNNNGATKYLQERALKHLAEIEAKPVESAS